MSFNVSLHSVYFSFSTINDDFPSRKFYASIKGTGSLLNFLTKGFHLFAHLNINPKFRNSSFRTISSSIFFLNLQVLNYV